MVRGDILQFTLPQQLQVNRFDLSPIVNWPVVTTNNLVSNLILSRKSGSTMSYFFSSDSSVGASGAIFGLVSWSNVLLETLLTG